LPSYYDLLDDFSAPSEASFSITTASVMTEYSEGFDRLLLRLVPITAYYAIFYHRKLLTTLDVIDATTKVQRLFDLHIRSRQMQLDSLDGAIDKAPVSFICLPHQFRCVYKLIALVALSNVVGVSLSVFKFLGVPRGECAVYQRDDEEIVHFRCTWRNAIKHAKPSYMIADSVSRRRIVKSKPPVLAFHLRAPRDSVLWFLTDIACGFPDFPMIDVNDAESQFIRSLIGAPFNRRFNNFVLFNVQYQWARRLQRVELTSGVRR
jgi:hypothetical protein